MANQLPTGKSTGVLASSKQNKPFTLYEATLIQGFTDADNDTLSVIGLMSDSGEVNELGGGQWVFMPDSNFSGAVTFDYLVTDSKSGNVSGSLKLDVIAENTNVVTPNRAPTGNSTAVLTNGSQNTAYTLSSTDLLKGFTDPDGDALNVVALISDSGEVKETSNGQWLFTPETDFSGKVTFDYLVTDNKSGSVQGALTLEVITSSLEKPIEPTLPPTETPVIEKPVVLEVFPTLKTPKMTTIKIDGRTISKDSQPNKILGEGKNDKLSGLAGNDTLLGNAGDDVLDGGKGNDSIDAGNGNDQLLGGDGNDKLLAGSGNDWLNGGKGNDKLNGDLGNDVLIGGEGVDTMEGGDGDDYYVVENVKDVVTETNNNLKVGGNDTVETKLKTYTLGKNVENLLLTELSDSTGNGNELNNQIVGNIGDNSLNGMDGNDQLFGGKGADTLDGGKGMDTLVGGDDDDVYIIQNDEDQIIETENGGEQDQIFSSVDYSLDESPYIEVLTLSGANAISGVGNDADNLIQEAEGGKVANELNGEAGDDLLNGEGGDDTLNGGTGNDTLNGGDGSDTAIFNNVKDEYAIIRNRDVDGVPQVIVEYVGYGENEGRDELNGIEIIQFSDGDTLNVAEIEIVGVG